MTLTQRLPGILSLIGWSRPARCEMPRIDRSAEDAAERQVLRDLMEHCPDAFTCEQDLGYAMWVYPGRF